MPPLRTKDKPYLDVISESVNNPLRLAIGWAMVDPATLPPASVILAFWLGGAYLMAAKRLSEYRELASFHPAAIYQHTVNQVLRAQPVDWSDIELVVFDVDGTLYNQRSLRMHMARDAVVHAARTRSMKLISVLRTYRRIREQLADEEAEDFETALIAQTSSIGCCPPETVRMMVDEWIEERPLSYLARCRYRGLQDLFPAFRRKKKIIGIFSDYPADAKLAALGLPADLVVSAHDDRVRILKPHPRGLQVLLAEAGVKPASALLIGDRPERDGFAAQRAGLRALIRSSKPIAGWHTFASYDGPMFSTILGAR